MNKLDVKPSTVPNETPKCSINFNWVDNPDVRHLLDTISSIIANEFIKVAKKNPEVFSNIPPQPNLLPEGEKE